MDDEQPGFLQRTGRKIAPKDARQNRSNAMVVLGLILFVLAAALRAANPDGPPAGAIIFGLFGAGLIIGGLVIRR